MPLAPRHVTPSLHLNEPGNPLDIEETEMTKQTRKAKRDIYQEVTDKVIAALEAGTDPWAMPWKAGGALPRNGSTGKVYSGINVLMLNMVRLAQDYKCTEWFTFKQMQDLGGSLRPDQKGTLGVFYKKRVIKEENEQGEEEEKTIPMLRHFHVFNRDQIEGLPETEESEMLDEADPGFWIEAAEQLVSASEAKIEIQGDMACYRPVPDHITMPDRQRFNGNDAEGHWYATLLHELSHWTGHKTRLSRPGITERGNRESYAYEELIAEQSAMMLCGTLGIKSEMRHGSYIVSWLKALRNDKKFIFKSAAEAQKATIFLLENAGMMGLLDAEAA